MSKFSLTVDAMGLARQIASLVYSGGQLRMKLTPHTILNSGIKYIIELVGDKVIGVIGYELVRDNVAELKHLSVHPSYRRQGLGKRLLTKAIAAAPAEYLFGLIRSNNVASLNNARSLGLMPIGTKKAYGNYHLIVVAKKKTLGRSVS